MLAPSRSTPALGVGGHVPGKRVNLPRPIGPLEQGFEAFCDGPEPCAHMPHRRPPHTLPAAHTPEPAFASKKRVACAVTPFSTGRDWSSSKRHIEPPRPRTSESRGIRIVCAPTDSAEPAASSHWPHWERRHIDPSVHRRYADAAESSLHSIVGAKKKDIDVRNGYGVCAPGDKPYIAPEDSQFFFHSSHVPSSVWRPPKVKTTSTEAIRPSRFLEGKWTAYGQSQHSLDGQRDEEINEVRNLDAWKPFGPQATKSAMPEARLPAISAQSPVESSISITPPPPPLHTQQGKKKAEAQLAAKKSK